MGEIRAILRLSSHSLIALEGPRDSEGGSDGEGEREVEEEREGEKRVSE